MIFRRGSATRTRSVLSKIVENGERQCSLVSGLHVVFIHRFQMRDRVEILYITVVVP